MAIFKSKKKQVTQVTPISELEQVTNALNNAVKIFATVSTKLNDVAMTCAKLQTRKLDEIASLTEECAKLEEYEARSRKIMEKVSEFLS